MMTKSTATVSLRTTAVDIRLVRSVNHPIDHDNIEKTTEETDFSQHAGQSGNTLKGSPAS